MPNQVLQVLDQVIATLYPKPHSVQNNLQCFLELDQDSEDLRSWTLSTELHLKILGIGLVSATLPTPHEVSFKLRTLDLANILPVVCSPHTAIDLLCRPYQSKQ